MRNYASRKTTTTRETLYSVLKGGVEQFAAPGRVEADGTVRLKSGNTWSPIVLKSECEARGLDPQAVRQSCKPVGCLATLGVHGDVEVTTREAIQTRRDVAASKALADLETNVPGLAWASALWARLVAAREGYSRDFEKLIASESNDGVRPPTSIVDLEREWSEFAAAHPRAILYRAAERQVAAASVFDPIDKEEPARKALEILASGGSIDDAREALAFRKIRS